MSRSLLIELGCEELPARFVRPGLAQLRATVESLLTEARISFGEARVYGTPRRLSVMIGEVASAGEDLVDHDSSAAFTARCVVHGVVVEAQARGRVGRPVRRALVGIGSIGASLQGGRKGGRSGD